MIEFDKSKKYILACSGGPDSMALLNMLYEKHYDFIVANVNYKTRKESDLEEKLVKDYCKKKNIKCFTKIYVDDNSKDSFEVKARNFRYKFFKELYDKYNLDGLFVAHHKDDVIETYLLKKQRNVINNSYLINEYSYIMGMDVLRPLVKDYYKKDLLDYCNQNNIPYSIDITNFSNDIPRNKIRNSLVNKDKEKIYKEALVEEEILQSINIEVSLYLMNNKTVKIDDIKNRNKEFLSILLYQLIDINYKKKVNNSLYLKLLDFINSFKANLKYKIYNNYYLVKEYDTISFKYLNDKPYKYVLDSFKECEFDKFKITSQGLKMEGIYLNDDDYPIIIRNYNLNDKIKLKEGTKKVSRLFIDKKIALEDRINYPVIENNKGEIVFVYKLYRKYGLKDVKNNLFVIK